MHRDFGQSWARTMLGYSVAGADIGSRGCDVDVAERERQCEGKGKAAHGESHVHGY